MIHVETMNALSQRAGDLSASIAASHEAIEAFCWDFQQWLGTELSSRDAFASELLLREALVNAAEHGCAGSPDRMIQCVVRGGKGRILIAVSDPGPGFDWTRRLALVPDATATSGRGVSIYKNYATRIRFNKAGNSIFILMQLNRPSLAAGATND
jgi:anti-sigma regulatory factor (Ser/Thr protein kinase)